MNSKRLLNTTSPKLVTRSSVANQYLDLSSAFLSPHFLTSTSLGTCVLKDTDTDNQEPEAHHILRSLTSPKCSHLPALRHPLCHHRTT